jgi:hypothetical protein
MIHCDSGKVKEVLKWAIFCEQLCFLLIHSELR